MMFALQAAYNVRILSISGKCWQRTAARELIRYVRDHASLGPRADPRTGWVYVRHTVEAGGRRWIDAGRGGQGAAGRGIGRSGGRYGVGGVGDARRRIGV